MALSTLASTELPKASGVTDAGRVGATSIVIHFALYLQYLLPALLVAGAVISAYGSRKDSTLFDRLFASGTPDFHTLNWRAFERVVGEAFRRKGYEVEMTEDGPDGGVDAIARRDGRRYLVQCKHWRRKKVGVTQVRELYGVVAAQNADGGFVVTSGRFTDEARRFAAGQAIYLMDGDDLRTVNRELQRDADSASPSPSAAAPRADASPACPLCNAPMVRRTARKGPGAGTAFLGCSRFPECRGTLPLEKTHPIARSFFLSAGTSRSLEIWA